MLQGLCQIHNCNLIHGDLNPEHILVDPITQDLFLCRLKICGFSQARSNSGAIPPESSPVYWYKAPEQLVHYKIVDAKADVFSAGCVICEMLTGVPIF